ncbi:hypothetical protein Tco_1153445 [Tanacetum coccineum]
MASIANDDFLTNLSDCFLLRVQAVEKERRLNILLMAFAKEIMRRFHGMRMIAKRDLGSLIRTSFGGIERDMTVSTVTLLNGSSWCSSFWHTPYYFFNQVTEKEVLAGFADEYLLLSAGRPKFNSVRPNINTGRTNISFGRSKVNNVSPKVNSVSSKVNSVRQTSNSLSPKRQQMNQIGDMLLRPQQVIIGGTLGQTSIITEHPLKNMVDRGIFDSGCSGHMTGNKDQLEDFEEFNGGSVTFGGSKGYNLWYKRIKLPCSCSRSLKEKTQLILESERFLQEALIIGMTHIMQVARSHFTSLRTGIFDTVASYDEEGVYTDSIVFLQKLKLALLPRQLGFISIHPKSQRIGDPKSVWREIKVAECSTNQESTSWNEGHWPPKWGYKNKVMKEVWFVEKTKARLWAQGYTLEEGIDYDEVFALVASEEVTRYQVYSQAEQGGIFNISRQVVTELIKKFDLSMIWFPHGISKELLISMISKRIFKVSQGQTKLGLRDFLRESPLIGTFFLIVTMVDPTWTGKSKTCALSISGTKDSSHGNVRNR